MRNRVFCLSFILMIFLLGILINIFHKNIEVNDTLISVTVKGAVISQGVYFCRYGISVADILEICGGMSELGFLPDNFDYNTPITNDIIITIPKRYSDIRKNYEEN
ncbi:hypothetical protein [Brachyspira alvinipulli]|uniref:hypothetical protein n=1 Tax=Brachyspira alvinipulli TaxID=84379 RepID=UPI0004802DDC